MQNNQKEQGKECKNCKNAPTNWKTKNCVVTFFSKKGDTYERK